MKAKSRAEIRKVVVQAMKAAEPHPSLKEKFRSNHIKVLSRAPYDLTLDDLIKAHDDPKLNLQIADPWLGG